MDTDAPPRSPSGVQKVRSATTKSAILLSMLASTVPVAWAQNGPTGQCISLSGSATCPAFNRSSVSTSPFLAFVSNTQQFDDQLSHYVATNYAQLKYRDLLGCSNLNLSNTTQLYARFTTSVVCNAIVQNSKQACSLSDQNARPLCADTCAQQAISEQMIISNNDTCSMPRSGAMDQIRADFTVCALPADSLSGHCVSGAENEHLNCGFQSNIIGLCQYCGSSSPNSTDSCCLNSDLKPCVGLKLPTISLPPLFPTTTATSTASAKHTTPAAVSSGLSGGAIAGIVIGSLLGVALVIGLIIFFCLRRRDRGSEKGTSIFNQPSPQRKTGGGMAFNPVPGAGSPQKGYEVLSGGRIARMSALEGPSDHTPYAAGGVADSRQRTNGSSSDGFRDSPESQARSARGDPLRAPPAGRRNGSLSSGSVLAAGENPSSPLSESGGEFSSPQGVASQQSEQLPFFKDYYSQDEIHPNDKVATLWAYQPRAGDEFELERGDMLKVVGIWDDGWATGVRLNEKAEDWESKRKAQRDSGVSSGTGRRESSPPPSGEIKAFPLVCVCLPEHWKKTLESDGSTETGSGGETQPPQGS
ncbi:MAG: hypothetical protein M1839_004015 [Geoglossum umbratile]|nr:MAG: hypothetical protein M1839_004015 [Geoglossum umbratile]